MGRFTSLRHLYGLCDGRARLVARSKARRRRNAQPFVARRGVCYRFLCGGGQPAVLAAVEKRRLIRAVVLGPLVSCLGHHDEEQPACEFFTSHLIFRMDERSFAAVTLASGTGRNGCTGGRCVWLLLVLFLLIVPSAAQELRRAIETPIDNWRPVRPGIWKVTSTMSDESGTKLPQAATTSACPYPAILFLNNLATIRLAESGCRYSTYRLSDQVFHIAAHCKALGGGDHVETTTLQASGDGRRFTTATTWSTSRGSVTLQRDGEFVAECRAN